MIVSFCRIIVNNYRRRRFLTLVYKFWSRHPSWRVYTFSFVSFTSTMHSDTQWGCQYVYSQLYYNLAFLSTINKLLLNWVYWDFYNCILNSTSMLLFKWSGIELQLWLRCTQYSTFGNSFDCLISPSTGEVLLIKHMSLYFLCIKVFES